MLGMSALARATRSYRVGASYDVLPLSVAAIEGTIHGESQAVAVGKIGGWSGIAAGGVLVATVSEPSRHVRLCKGSHTQQGATELVSALRT